MGNDYFIFNGIKSTDKSIYLRSYNHMFLPANNRVFLNIPGRDGSLVVGNDSKEDVLFNCEVAIVGEDEKDILNKIEEANLWLSKRGKLSFWDMNENRYYIGEVTGEISTVSQETFDEFVLVFRCFPIKFGETKTLSFTNSITFENKGTYNAEGTLRINIAETIGNVKVTLVNTGEYVAINHNFVKDDVVLIDFKDEEVYKNNHLIMEDCHLESDFFSIPVGKSTITTNTGNSILEYTERWL